MFINFSIAWYCLKVIPVILTDNKLYLPVKTNLVRLGFEKNERFFMHWWIINIYGKLDLYMLTFFILLQQNASINEK